MISFLRSKFDIFPRRLLVVTGLGLAAYTWSEKQLRGPDLFAASEEGVDQFSRYLSETPNVPTYMMVDLLEEEYRAETVPHVMGGDRKALVEHRLSRLFRETPYTHAEFQGRLVDGRRDDRVLLTALTNPKTLAPWMQQLTRQQVQVAAIWSLPLVTEGVMSEVDEASPSSLLISLHSASGLRQSFYDNGRLQISRLVRVPGLEQTQSPANYIIREVEKIRRYLVSMHLFTQERPLDVYILCQGKIRTDLQKQTADTPMTRFHLVDLSLLSRRVGLDNYPDSSNSDALVAHMVMRNPPDNHYAGKQDRRYFSMYRLRAAMLAASVVILIGSLMWSGMNLIDAVSFHEQGIASARQANYYQARYQLAREDLPPTPVEAEDMKYAVEMIGKLKQYKASPINLMALISSVLSHYPDLSIDSIEWSVSSRPGGDQDQGAGLAARFSRLFQAGVPEVPTGPEGLYHIAEITGKVHQFEGNYRKALELVNDFANSLSVNEGVREVQRLRMPLNVSSDERMVGDASAERRSESGIFVLKVVLFQPNEPASGGDADTGSRGAEVSAGLRPVAGGG